MKAFVYIFVLLMLMPVGAQSALYRWVDAKGKVHYSDQVPPEEAQHERKIIDSKSGRTIDTIERNKTLEELQELKRLQKIRAEEREREEQRRYKDRVLLLTYQSTAEIVAARDTKIQTIENTIENVLGTRKSQKGRLNEARNRAADFERSSRPIPKKVLDDIKMLRAQIKKSDQYISNKRQEQEQIRKEFAGYISRYNELTE